MKKGKTQQSGKASQRVQDLLKAQKGDIDLLKKQLDRDQQEKDDMRKELEMLRQQKSDLVTDLD